MWELMRLKGLLYVILVLFLICITDECQAFEQVYQPQNEVHLGLAVAYQTIEGDFDGESYLGGESDIFLLPSFENSYGFEVMVGVRTPRFGFELSFIRSNLDGSWLALPYRASLSVINFDFEAYLLKEKLIIPYLLIGVDAPILIIKDAALTENSTDDASLFGGGLNIGAGIEYRFLQRLTVHAESYYRLVDYTSVRGHDDRLSIEGELWGNGLSFNMGISITCWRW